MEIFKRIAAWARRPRQTRADKTEELRRQVARSDKELAAHKKRLEKCEAQMEKEMARGRQAVDKAVGLNKQLGAALAAAEEALATANEIVIPGLVEANQTFKNAWAAESAQHVMRQVALAPEKGPS